MLEGYKTVIFFGLTLVVSVAGLFGFADWLPTNQQSDIILAVVSLVGLMLRIISSGPVFFKK